MKKLLFVSMMALAFAAGAKEGGKDPFAACRADFDKLCKDVKPGEGRQVKCMMDNKSRASSACQAVLAEKEAKEKQWKANKVKHEKP